jgi:predicted MPP superfamily phosphohydrolase
MNPRFLIILVVMLAIDLYFYQSISTLLKNASLHKKNTVFYIYWGFTAFSFSLILINFLYPFRDWNQFIRIYVVAFVIGAFICKFFGSIFILADDLIRLFRWIASYIAPSTAPDPLHPHSISRLKFMSQLAVVMAGLPYLGLIYGMFKSGFDIRVKQVQLNITKLPDSFNGLKIVQISDIHCGSFTSTNHFENAVRIINEQKPDILFFTGDLVNDVATETEKFIETFSKFTAPMGVYSCLGNHDYGDYVKWESAEEKEKNLTDLKAKHKQFGWNLLLNEHVTVQKGEDKIAILGIENWGARGFTKYGDLDKAHAGTQDYPVKLLLSHDPSHWEAEVLKEFPDIDAAFAGHTHGMQFGIEIPGFKWSPVQYVYKQWAGLYKSGDQFLYVNRGLGFIGYPGRVGILPEITVFELSNKA